MKEMGDLFNILFGLGKEAEESKNISNEELNEQIKTALAELIRKHWAAPVGKASFESETMWDSYLLARINILQVMILSLELRLEKQHGLKMNHSDDLDKDFGELIEKADNDSFKTTLEELNRLTKVMLHKNLQKELDSLKSKKEE